VAITWIGAFIINMIINLILRPFYAGSAGVATLGFSFIIGNLISLVVIYFVTMYSARFIRRSYSYGDSIKVANIATLIYVVIYAIFALPGLFAVLASGFGLISLVIGIVGLVIFYTVSKANL